MDGNGRMGRFLMNLMMAAGGYPDVDLPIAVTGKIGRVEDAGGHARREQFPVPFR
jgi:hypothetical protein